MSLEPAGIDALCARILRQVTDADVAMQHYQILAWREAARYDAQFYASAFAEAGDLPQLLPEITQGIDRLTNLALSETTLELRLETKKPVWWCRLWHFLTHTPCPPSTFRLARSDVMNAPATLIITVKRQSNGDWESSHQIKTP